jgi:hypothetical protein
MPWAPLVFVGHPTSLSSAFALWLPSPDKGAKWKEAAWMAALAPFTFAYSLLWMCLSPLLCQPYLWVDHFHYDKVVCGVWLSRVWGWKFISHPIAAHRNIKAILRVADRSKVQVLGLGSLNKAEFVNGSGEKLVHEVRPTTTRVVHGNTLTAAVVVENVVRVSSAHTEDPHHDPPLCSTPSEPSSLPSAAAAPSTNRPKTVFLTGPTSKVGRAVALQLVRRGFAVRCATSSAERFEELAREAAALAPVDGCELGSLDWAHCLAQGVDCSVWVIGKYDLRVRDHIPMGGTAVVFSVPCPLTYGEGGRNSMMSGSRFHRHGRDDVRVVDGGLLRLDAARCSAREFPILLPEDHVYACHAAAMVHLAQGWTHHEVGKVDLSSMQTVLDAAFDMGMALPPLPPDPTKARVKMLSLGAPASCQPPNSAPSHAACATTQERASCVVVGGGASGLAVAACLKKRGYGQVVVLEANNVIQGHWGTQYDELRITSRKAHCELPHYTIDAGSLGAGVGGAAGGGTGKRGHGGKVDDTLSAGEFVSYLQRYAKRFGLDVRLGCRVKSARHEPAQSMSSTEGACAHSLNVDRSAGGFWVVKYSCCGGVDSAEERVLVCSHLVDASGRHARPHKPPSLLDPLQSFDGEVLHSSQVTGLAKLAMQDVVIVGLGNSAADIAMALLDHGARRVRVCVRSMPTIVRRQWGPLSVEWVSLLALQHLPRVLADLCVEGFVACFFGARWWVPYAPPGTRSWTPYSSQRVPVIDKWAGTRSQGGLVQSIKEGRLLLSGPITAAAGRNLFLSSPEGGGGEGGGGGGGGVDASGTGRGEGSWVPCDAVIFATGFLETSQEWLASAPVVVPDTACESVRESVRESFRSGGCSPGSPFRVGFSHGAALLPLRQIGKEARAVAAVIETRDGEW